MSSPKDDITPQRAVDIERKELLRLMGTAKSDERKAIIRESLVNLDCPPDRKHSPKRLGSAAIAASRFNNIFETEKVAAETVFLKSPPVRPMSARLRRPSMNNLDAIQEEKKMPLSLDRVSDKDQSQSLVKIQLDDVCAISTSCHDPRFSQWDPFSTRSSSRWMSTGMLPHFVSIELHMSWLMMEVKIKCTGVMKASICFEESSMSSIPLKMENSTTFTYSTSRTFDHSTGKRSNKSYGDRITITLEEASEMFVSIDSIQISALRTG